MKSGANVNARNLHNMTPLHNASECGGLNIIKLLLNNGADVNAQGWHGKTPLHLASVKGSFGVSRLLVKHGADINAEDDEHNTPLSIALGLGNRHRALARFLSKSNRITASRDTVSGARVEMSQVRPIPSWPFRIGNLDIILKRSKDPRQMSSTRGEVVIAKRRRAQRETVVEESSVG